MIKLGLANTRLSANRPLQYGFGASTLTCVALRR